MASVSITTRTTKAGKSYAVRFRLGGRTYPIVHGGSFRTMKEARARRDLIAGELASGRNPADLLAALLRTPAAPTTIDVDRNTTKNYRSAIKKINATFGNRDASTVSVAEVAGWVSSLAGVHKPGTV
jgi:hypothetical protein